MAVPKPMLDARGKWQGKSRLHLSWLPEDQRITESESDLVVAADPNCAYATVKYTWVHEGKAQSGLLLVAAGENGDASGGWADSWHQSGGVLALKGAGPDDGPLRLTGSYSAGEPPEWGWRIEVESSESELVLRMINITPDGDEEWAVEGRYQKI